MKMMIWKEFRENLMWAVLGSVATALACAWLISQNISSNDWIQLWTVALPQPFALLSPLLGAVLGFLQTSRELKPDQRAFLLHRPISRSTIFAGKTVAGLCLYVLATALPLLGAGLWLRMPGHVPGPFDWRLLLPEIVGIFTGFSFYFAAIITATRPVRWLGSKALALPAAVVCTLLSSAPHHFGLSILLTVVFALILALAAWGTFVSGGSYSLQSKVTRAGLGASLYVGLYAVCMAALALALSIFSSRQPPFTWSRYETDIQGRMALVTRTGTVIDKVTDIAGQPLKAPGGKSRWSDEDFLSGPSIDIHPLTVSYREPRTHIWPLFSYRGSDSGHLWYFLPESGLLASYSVLTNKLEGYLGASGYAPATAPPPVPLKGHFLNSYYEYGDNDLLRFSDALYRFDDEGRRLVPLYKVAPPNTLTGAIRLYRSQDSEARFKRLMVATAGKFICLSPEGRVLYSTVNKYAGTGPLSVDMALRKTDGHIFVWYRPSHLSVDHLQRPTYVTELTVQGRATNGYTLPPIRQMKAASSFMDESLPALITPPSAIAAFAIYVRVAKALKGATGSLEAAEYNGGPPNTVTFIGFSFLAALISAFLAARICRRCRFGRGATVAWLIGVFLLGPFGVLLLMSLQEWPARETCDSCGKLRVVTADQCEHCGAGWPATERDGTEIFEETQTPRLKGAATGEARLVGVS